MSFVITEWYIRRKKPTNCQFNWLQLTKMAKLCVFMVLCIAAVALAGPQEKHFLNDGRAHAKLIRLEELAHNLAVAYRKLVVDTPVARARLGDCTNEVLRGVFAAIVGINPAVASIKDPALHENQCKLMEALSETANSVQQHVCGSADKLKEVLANSCDKICEATRTVAKHIDTHDCKDEIYLGNQFRHVLNHAIFTAQKVKYEIDFGKKSSKELIPEIDAAQEEFCKNLQNLRGDEHRVKEELTYLIQTLERIEELAVTKLENFVHINEDDHKNVAIAKEVSKGLSTSCDNLHQLSTGDHDANHVKTELEKLYKVATSVIKKLCEIDVGETSPSDLLIRSILFDSLTASKVYDHELSQSAHLSTKTTKTTKN